ncbi:MAG: MFS transporter, partial [Duncaniella sp.]|nr:MFS transporter [Duncaniella sp.]
ITFWTSLILLPWTIKPLWSPFLEIFRTKKFYVVTTQLVTGVAFGLTALSLRFPDFFPLAVFFLFIVAFSGATHDIACDGVYMSELTPSQQSSYIGWQGAFYNIAKIVASGGLIYLAGWIIKRNIAVSGTGIIAANCNAWMTIMGILSAVMILLGFYHIFILPSTVSDKSGGTSGKVGRDVGQILDGMWNVMRRFFSKKHILVYIIFILLYRFGEGFVVKVVPLFLKASREAGGLGLDTEQIGLYYGTYGAAAFVIGSILAGYYISAFGLRRVLFSLVCAFNLPFVVYVYLAWVQPESGWIIASGIVFEYFGYGFGFVGLTLFMMQQIAPGKHQMAHYAFASGIMNLGVMIPGMMSGWLADRCGYLTFFVIVMICTIPAFIMSRVVPFRCDDDGNLLEAETAALTESEAI